MSRLRIPSGISVAILVVAGPGGAQGLPFGELRGMLPADDEYSFALATGDVDADGDLDLVVANDFSQYPDRLYRNDGIGNFSLDPDFPEVSGFRRDVALGDADGDGSLDVFLPGYSIQDVLLLNDGSGGFTDATANLPADISWELCLDLGDVDGDGDLDVYLGTGFGCAFDSDRLLLNDGTGTYTDASHQLPGEFQATSAVALLDADGDGDQDAVLHLMCDSFAPTAVGQYELHRNDGTGSFSVADGAMPSLPTDAVDVAVADLDGDSDLDLFSVELPPATFLNDGTGVFTHVQVAFPGEPLPGNSIVCGGLGDLDGDGAPDAAFVAGDRLHVLANDGAGALSSVAAGSADGIFHHDLLVADLDGDQDPDVVTARSNGRNQLFLNDGEGGLVNVVTSHPSADASFRVAAATDVDADGIPDLFLAGQGTYSLSLGRGNGEFELAAENVPPIERWTQAIEFFDADGDGDPDVYVGNGPGSFLGSSDSLLLNDGTGVFTEGTGLPWTESSTTDVATGDVDGDGDVDCIRAVDDDGAGLLLNDGRAVFHYPFEQPDDPHSDECQAVELGDLDGDGDLDLVSATSNDESRVFSNDGAGLFTELPGALAGHEEWTKTVVLFDKDNDGDLDLFVGNFTLDPNRLYENDGTSVFTEVSADLPEDGVVYTEDARAGDVDLDGDEDLVVIENEVSGVDDHRVYRNEGGGSFEAVVPADPAPISSPLWLELADLDLDGDPDLVLPMSTAVRIYSNLHRQLARRGAPRVDAPFLLDLHGPPGGLWVLASAAGTVQLSVPPFGLLRLDPLTLGIFGAGFLDGDGRGTFGLLVPRAPELVGETVPWQAAVGAPLRLTNLELTTFTAL